MVLLYFFGILTGLHVELRWECRERGSSAIWAHPKATDATIPGCAGIVIRMLKQLKVAIVFQQPRLGKACRFVLSLLGMLQRKIT